MISQSLALATCFVLAFVPQTAMASAECAKVKNDINRLACYDSAYKGTANKDVAPSVEEAYEAFVKLAGYEGELGYRLIQMDGCRLYEQSLLIFRDPVGKLVPSAGTFWQLLVDLDAVEIEKTVEKFDGSLTIVMQRGAELHYSSLWRRQQSRAPLNYDIETGFDPEFWVDYVQLEQNIATHHRADGTQGDQFMTTSARSVDWRFSTYWPEDKDEINRAFRTLVRSCQK